MRKRRYLIGAMLGVLGALVLSGTAQAGSPISHKLTVTVAPKKQSKKTFGPASLHLITDTTYDNFQGSPSSREALFNLSKDLRVGQTGNLPQCPQATLTAATTAAAVQAACGASVVGTGFTLVNAGTGAFTAQNPVVTVAGGGPNTIYVWLRVAGALTQVLTGKFNVNAHTLLVTGLPNVPGTDLTLFDVQLNKKKTSKSTFFVMARCGKKKKWTNSETVTFHNGQQLTGTSTQRCTQRK
jgi:hypothetical protein